MASKLRVDEITGGTGSTVSIGTATFTGGGGGAAGGATLLGGNGGSGIVIIAYPTA